MSGGEIGIIVAQSCAAIGTLTLALAAFKTIRQTKQIQSEIRKEQQLKEIAEWAVDVMNAFFEVEVPFFPYLISIRNETTEEKHLADSIKAKMLTNVSRELNLMISRGQFIQHIAKQTDYKLYREVENTISSVIRERDYILDELFLDFKAEFVVQTREAAKKVLKRVSELKGGG